MPEQLNVPSIPVEIQHIWNWWLQLNETRSSGMDLCRITYTEIKAWSELLQIKVCPFEIECINILDGIYMRIRSEQLKRNQPSKDT